MAAQWMLVQVASSLMAASTVIRMPGMMRVCQKHAKVLCLVHLLAATEHRVVEYATPTGAACVELCSVAVRTQQSVV